MATEQRAPIDPEVAGAEEIVTSNQATVQAVPSPLRHNPRTDCPTYMGLDFKQVHVDGVGGRIWLQEGTYAFARWASSGVLGAGDWYYSIADPENPENWEIVPSSWWNTSPSAHRPMSEAPSERIVRACISEDASMWTGSDRDDFPTYLGRGFCAVHTRYIGGIIWLQQGALAYSRWSPNARPGKGVWWFIVVYDNPQGWEKVPQNGWDA